MVSSRQENLQLYMSALKTVALRTQPGACKWLVDDETLPLFERAMQFAAHDEDIVRTASRNALLLLLTTFKEQGEVLHIALDMVAQTLLGRALAVLVYTYLYILALSYIVHCIDMSSDDTGLVNMLRDDCKTVSYIDFFDAIQIWQPCSMAKRRPKVAAIAVQQTGKPMDRHGHRTAESRHLPSGCWPRTGGKSMDGEGFKANNEVGHNLS